VWSPAVMFMVAQGARTRGPRGNPLPVSLTHYLRAAQSKGPAGGAWRLRLAWGLTASLPAAAT
jgi:hypothetical protein